MKATNPLLLAGLIACTLFAKISSAQDCSKTKLCATGYCSKFGFCGTTDEHCGEVYSPENCVSGCQSKSYCNPGGYGPDYVEIEKCPLNVCCSKFGFCGTTSEFCAGKEVARPQCSSAGRKVQRVIGYFESWAPKRACQAFQPEDIPVGVYSHLIFAFAGIDPVTFEIVPGSPDNIDLYPRITALEKKDPDLKVLIAVGGWAFNNPGPTTTTFSDVARSPTNRIRFTRSVLKFLITYDFDSVNIDWEYPSAEDRSGRLEDFKNFPILISDLREALNMSGRNILTLTTPISYCLIKPIDFFNVMSYDLHSIWDKGSKWLRDFLNAHTNITEITNYLDLFWRNNINPAKITLGLAFYSRTFTVADRSCTTPRCRFDSGGNPGPYTRDTKGGTLSIAEISDLLPKSSKPVIDEKAMVKMTVANGNQWIAYDDLDTWKLKIDAANRLCPGGVIVWAVS
ncbi:glycoside hydrolase superfamily [Microdochium trichocladiopsis]|uniref:chitinase n=1 Tax=Microdochium trichocladiopsis TaxID=1682393 RepID=A0A9P8YGY4_9PEZI|nr:glycoside hydrolase superfamily [Microdochium trichocladiopsis]KAH7039788.1 glycoside hydrolase superfamily [Microdochium trichocladiopsis]